MRKTTASSCRKPPPEKNHFIVLWSAVCLSAILHRQVNSTTKKMSVSALLQRFATLRKKGFPDTEKDLDLKRLSYKLEIIESGLQDAENSGFTDVDIKNWVKRIDDVVYEMDNVLDEWETANLQQLQGSEELSDPLAKVRYFVISLCFCFKYVMGRREIVKKMKALSARIDNILEERSQHNFVSSVQGSTSMIYDLRIYGRDLDKVYGRDLDKDNLVKQLLTLEDDSINEGVQIITIFGLAGVGKTTLAQLAYNDNQVKENFQKQTWVSVTQSFDLSQVAKDILKCLGSASANFHASFSFNTLLGYVKEALENEKFLIVLDNLWTEDCIKWECLSRCLCGRPGSKILVTTRHESTAKIIRSNLCLPLPLVSDFDCWKILKGIAFNGRTNDDCEKLMKIGFDIAKKLNGLPLAAKGVGSMLASRGSEQQWLDVLNNPLWNYKDELSDLFELLLLSYMDLCPVLKRCFLSCIVYPKRSPICVDKVSMIWMAHGYLNSSAEVEDVELKGLEFFNMLTMRSFFQELKEKDENGEDVVVYTMQDIVHEFANYLAGTNYSWIMYSGQGGKNCESKPLDSLAKLHTFSATQICQEQLPLQLLHSLSSVRVFRIIGCGLQQLPKGVGNLMHMRLLDLSHNPIKELPETVINLYNLETLGLEHCYSLCKLPEGIDKLIKLRHLLNCGTSKLVQYPKGLERLSGLWTLSEFNITETSEMGFLRNLDQLSGSLRINFKKMREIGGLLEQARKANLKKKEHLQNLELICWEEIPNDVVDALQPPPNLESFVTCGVWGPCFFSWIDTSFSSLKKVSFDGLHICSQLPPFGKLPALEKLTISRCNFKVLSIDFFGIIKVGENDVQTESSNWTGCFRRLMKLHLKCCRSWEKWDDISEETQNSVPIMPNLQELKIHHCNKLKALPRYIINRVSSPPNLKLEIEHCTSLFDYS